MNIKSLLLGSAAAFVAVSGARAADAVVMVEPEPMEYVRVCDVYGTGFFYIPGTETCLKIGGYVRMRLQASSESRRDNFNRDDEFRDDDYNTNTEVRARLDFDAREETELGTLRAKIRVQATNNSNNDTGQYDTVGDAAYAMDEGYIQLGGLTMGYLDSAWTGDDGGIGDGLFTDSDWAAGDFQQNRISYTYAANGFSGTLSVEDDGDGDFIPDVIGKLAYTGGFGGAYVMGLYDEDTNDRTADSFVADNGFFVDLNGNGIIEPNEFDTVNRFFSTFEFDGGDRFDRVSDSSDGAFAVKAGIMLENLIAEDSALKIEGHYASDPTEYAIVGNLNGTVGNAGQIGGLNGITSEFIPSEYQIGAGYQQQFGKVFAAISGTYGETFDIYQFDSDSFLGTTDANIRNLGSTEYFTVAGNLGYDITSNFSVLAEVAYRDLDLPVGDDDFDQTSGFLEFKRSF